jgi:hypothetical protein
LFTNFMRWPVLRILIGLEQQCEQSADWSRTKFPLVNDEGYMTYGNAWILTLPLYCNPTPKSNPTLIQTLTLIQINP